MSYEISVILKVDHEKNCFSTPIENNTTNSVFLLETED